MMETIVSWIFYTLGEILTAIIGVFLSSLDMSLGAFIRSFPVAVAGYQMFQVIGIGLVIVLALFQMFKFFAGPLSESKDTPIRILVRSGLAVALIFFGGYFLTWVVNIAKMPYDSFLQLDAIDNTGMNAGKAIWDTITGIGAVSLPIGALSAGASMVISLILGFVIGWNLIKLMIEVVERFLMVGLLAYSSPLAFSTLCSHATSDIFSKYIQMFGGQCILMTLSVWSLKLILSAFGAIDLSSSSWPVTLIMILGMCRIAQRLDSYMQQLGIGVGTTGGSLLDEMLSMARTAMMFTGYAGGKHAGSKSAGGKSADGSEVLGATKGADGKYRPDPVGFGAVGGVRTGLRYAKQAAKEGGVAGNVGNIVKEAGAGFMAGFAGKDLKGHFDKDKSVGENLATAAKRNIVGNVFGRDGLQKYDERRYGPKKETAGSVMQAGDGTVVLDERARANGLSIKSSGKGGPMVVGSQAAVSKFMAANATNPAAQELIKNTAMRDNPYYAQQALFGNNADLKHNDFDGTSQKEFDEAMSSMVTGAVAGAETPFKDKAIEEMPPHEANVAQALDAMKTMGDPDGNHDTTHGTMENFRAQTMENGGRLVTADQKDSAGEQVGRMAMVDQKGYEGLTDAQKEGMVPLQTATGAMYYMKSVASTTSAGSVQQGATPSKAVPSGISTEPIVQAGHQSGQVTVTAERVTPRNGTSISDEKFTGKQVAPAVAEAAVGGSINRRAGELASNTITSDDFTPQQAQETIQQIGKAIPDGGAYIGAEEGLSGDAVATLATRAYGQEELTAAFEKAGEAFEASGAAPSSMAEDIGKFSEAFAHGSASGARNIQSAGIGHDGQIKAKVNVDSKSYDLKISRGPDGKPSAQITGYTNRYTQPHSGGGRQAPPSDGHQQPPKSPGGRQPRIPTAGRGTQTQGGSKAPPGKRPGGKK